MTGVEVFQLPLTSPSDLYKNESPHYYLQFCTPNIDDPQFFCLKVLQVFERNNMTNPKHEKLESFKRFW